jgi:hypothetical protein
MYYPYFRGKQYELIVIRDNAKLLADSGFVPIIEPVKDTFGPLERALVELRNSGGNAILIMNPQYGNITEDSAPLMELVSTKFADYADLSFGILLQQEITIAEIQELLERYSSHPITLIHSGFPDAKGLVDVIVDRPTIVRHIFIDGSCTELYPRHFKDRRRILIRDGFERKTNKNYPPFEAFSDLHITFSERGFVGFGDFLIVGDDYSETGGPAWAVAIHLTYIDPDKDDSMFVFHFVSDSQDTPNDPGGKFAEALEKLYLEAMRPSTPLLRTKAVEEFLQLRESRHFPGLGYVKKLSMQHHVELMAHFLSKK